MSEFNASNFKKEEGGQGPDLCGTTELTSPYFMVPPSGTTAQRPSGCAPGTLRFNTDIGSLEYFKGDTLGWESINRTTPNLGGAIGPTYAGSNNGTGVRAVISVGQRNPTPYNTDLDFITISTLGNAADFGNALVTRDKLGAAGDRTRGLFIGGEGVTDTIEYITFSTTSDAIDFGNIGHGGQMRFVTACANATRSVFGGGYTGPAAYNTLEYVTIQSTGNGVDFGDLIEAANAGASLASSTRGVFAGGNTHNYTANQNRIQYFTIASTGNTVDYGDLITAKCMMSGASNSTRGLFLGGFSPSHEDEIEYITIATTGNAIDFGNLTAARSRSHSASSPTRAICGAGSGPAGGQNSIDYVEIATTGNAVDFGDMNSANGSSGGAACSNGHGGL